MKKIITFIFVCLIGCSSLFMSSCGAKFKLNFIVDDQVYETIKTNGGKSVEMPQDPEKTGYVFEGWYWDEDIWQEPFTASVFVGGLAGLSRANVSNSSSTCNVTSISTNYIAYAGGLFGDVSSCTLFNLYARGNVSAKGSTLIYSRNGGLIGNKIVGITITDCYRDSKQVLTRFSTENSYFTDYGIVKDF